MLAVMLPMLLEMVCPSIKLCKLHHLNWYAIVSQEIRKNIRTDLIQTHSKKINKFVLAGYRVYGVVRKPESASILLRNEVLPIVLA